MLPLAKRYQRAEELLSACSGTIEVIRHSENSIYGMCQIGHQRHFFKCLPIDQAANEKYASEQLQDSFPSPRLIRFVPDYAGGEGLIVQEYRPGLFDHSSSA